jgi:hypothetical protein
VQLRVCSSDRKLDFFKLDMRDRAFDAFKTKIDAPPTPQLPTKWGIARPSTPLWPASVLLAGMRLAWKI